jgi:hypothetical protein
MKKLSEYGIEHNWRVIVPLYSLTFAVISLFCLMVFSAGCIVDVPDEPVATPTPTIAPANITPEQTPTKPIETPVPEEYKETVITYIKTAIPTPVESVIKFVSRTPTPSLTPTPAESNISAVTFTKYYDDDFSIEYPNTWKEQISTVNSDNLYIPKMAKVKATTRVITLDSGDGTTKFTAYTSDFIVPGIYDLDTSIYWAQQSVTPRFFDVSGSTALTNYEKHFTAFQSPYITFDVIIPPDTASYPFSYTERYQVSYSHYYIFEFSNNGTINDYKDIKKHMLDSLQAEERIYIR